MRRVVITGVGVRAPLSSDPVGLFDAILAGRSGVVAMPEWSEIADLETLVAAPVVDLDEQSIPRKVRRTMGRIAVLAACAARSAVDDARVPEALLRGGRTAVVVGSTAGSGAAEQAFWSHLTLQRSARGLKSTLFFCGMAHTAAANVALLLGCTGELLSTNSACASSNQAIGVGAERIRLGRADVVVAGGAEELHVGSGVIFDSLSAATHCRDPDATPRPFDRRRDGIVVGEGAGIVVLEALDHALARGAHIYGEVLGHGTSCDAQHMAAADPVGMVSAIERCLADAGADAPVVDYVNAHATGTTLGDAAEADAIYRVLGSSVPVSSSKGHLGHTLGACGAIETIICLEAMRRGIVPPTRGLTDPDVAPLNLPTEAMAAPLRRVLNMNFGFGGVNSVLLLGGREDGWS